ncbi:unnamed protein product [Gulo gulo]|uniref:Dysbindin n=1 Tax=Gulo gulo TaxID=48420 RepID=A0A9X9M4S6_GULGU|nr:unnamed protein product [Gulo gulo]
MLSAHWEKKRASLVQLQEQLQQLPGLVADLESMTASLTHLEASFEEVENHLLNLEDLCGQCELERYKHMQSQQLENYKKNKRKELETFKGNSCSRSCPGGPSFGKPPQGLQGVLCCPKVSYSVCKTCHFATLLYCSRPRCGARAEGPGDGAHPAGEAEGAAEVFRGGLPAGHGAVPVRGSPADRGEERAHGQHVVHGSEHRRVGADGSDGRI